MTYISRRVLFAAIWAFAAVATSFLLWTMWVRMLVEEKTIPIVNAPVEVEEVFVFSVDEDAVEGNEEEPIPLGEEPVKVSETTLFDVLDPDTLKAQLIATDAEENDRESAIHAAAERHSDLLQWEISPSWSSITIPSIGVRAPVLLPSRTYWDSQQWNLLEKQMQVGLNHGAIAYPHSVSPGRKGALIVAGHSSPPNEQAEESVYGALFKELPNVVKGDTITLSTPLGPVAYTVESKRVVPPHETSILEQTEDESVLKLITCYPVGTTRDRLIVVAKRIEER